MLLLYITTYRTITAIITTEHCYLQVKVARTNKKNTYISIALKMQILVNIIIFLWKKIAKTIIRSLKSKMTKNLEISFIAERKTR